MSFTLKSSLYSLGLKKNVEKTLKNLNKIKTEKFIKPTKRSVKNKLVFHVLKYFTTKQMP